MSDKTLRKAIIRLAHENPKLREHLLPLVREASDDADAEYKALVDAYPLGWEDRKNPINARVMTQAMNLLEAHQKRLAKYLKSPSIQAIKRSEYGLSRHAETVGRLMSAMGDLDALISLSEKDLKAPMR